MGRELHTVVSPSRPEPTSGRGRSTCNWGRGQFSLLARWAGGRGGTGRLCTRPEQLVATQGSSTNDVAAWSGRSTALVDCLTPGVRQWVARVLNFLRAGGAGQVGAGDSRRGVLSTSGWTMKSKSHRVCAGRKSITGRCSQGGRHRSRTGTPQREKTGKVGGSQMRASSKHAHRSQASMHRSAAHERG